ncbi:3604_t:CDS:2 [Paraglomus brasilianum]|uniref:Mitochondrial import inner membrane translocase subunit n=1 Tax=Paraglomus brasilianum TaxID=144538 RepID=A0A9N9FAG0_9GLOM|nr:3604_t:CDS:2 [Paraglomus brasilianum]
MSLSSDYNYSLQGNMDEKKKQVMDQVKAELALAQAHELINKMNEKCFAKCILKPGHKMENSEMNCIDRCVLKYMEAWNVVSRTYLSRVRREGQSLDSGI